MSGVFVGQTFSSTCHLSIILVVNCTRRQSYSSSIMCTVDRLSHLIRRHLVILKPSNAFTAPRWTLKPFNFCRRYKTHHSTPTLTQCCVRINQFPPSWTLTVPRFMCGASDATNSFACDCEDKGFFGIERWLRSKVVDESPCDYGRGKDSCG